MGMITTWLTRIIDRATSTDHLPKQLVEYQGGSSETTILFPYGMYSNVSNDVLALMFFAAGNSESRFAIPGSFQVRPDLEQGEVAIYRPDGDAIIKFSNNGDIAISTSKNVTIDCVDAEGTPTGDIIVNAVNATVTTSEDITLNCVNADINATGDITADCVNATITATTAATIEAPTITLDGNVTITGTLQVDGIATLGTGGALIARLGDTVAVTVPGVQAGPSALPGTGTITSGSPGGHTAS